MKRIVLAFAIAFAGGTALAQGAFPTDAVTMIVPFPPGGGTDTGARIVAQKLGAKWGQTVVVENKGGAAGSIGADAVAKAKPDGYTILMGNIGTQAINPSLYKKLPYDPVKGVRADPLVAELPHVMVVNPAVPANTRRSSSRSRRPVRASSATAARGPAARRTCAAEMFKEATGTFILHVPYRGGGAGDQRPARAATCRSRSSTVLEASGHVKAGKLRALAVTSSKRVARAARRADPRRDGRPRLQLDLVDRPARARRDAEGGGREDLGRRARGAGGRRRKGQAARARRDPVGHHAGAVPAVDRCRHPPLCAGDQGQEDHGRLDAASCPAQRVDTPRAQSTNNNQETTMDEDNTHSRRDFLKIAAGTGLAAVGGLAVAQSFDFKPNQRYPDPAVQILDPSFARYRIYSSTRRAGRDRHALGRGAGVLPRRRLPAGQRHPEQPDHEVQREGRQLHASSAARPTTPTATPATARAGSSPASTR